MEARHSARLIVLLLLVQKRRHSETKSLACRERLVHKQTISSDPTGINAFALVLVAAAPLPEALVRAPPAPPSVTCKFIPTKGNALSSDEENPRGGGRTLHNYIAAARVQKYRAYRKRSMRRF